jgi:chromosome segregation ATPase
MEIKPGLSLVETKEYFELLKFKETIENKGTVIVSEGNRFNGYLDTKLSFLTENETLDNLSKKIETLTNENVLLKDENSVLKSENDILKSDIEFLRTAISRLEETNESLSNQILELTPKVLLHEPNWFQKLFKLNIFR